MPFPRIEDCGSALPSIKERLALGLDYIVSDSEFSTESGGSIVSFEFGIDSILSIARMLLPRHLIKNWKGQVHANDVESLRHEIDGCIIALVARGKLQDATDLIRLAGCVMAIDRDGVGATVEEDTLPSSGTLLASYSVPEPNVSLLGGIGILILLRRRRF